MAGKRNGMVLFDLFEVEAELFLSPKTKTKEFIVAFNKQHLECYVKELFGQMQATIEQNITDKHGCFPFLNAIKVMHQTKTDYGQGNPRYTSDAHKDRASLP